MKTDEKIKNILPIFLFFIIIFLFFLPFFLTNTIPYAGDFSGSDLTELNLPLRFASAQSIISGQIPLWNHNLGNGFAILAEGQAGVFYPLNILYLFLPFAFAVNIGFFLNFFLAGVFTYYYARIVNISRRASFFSALSFSFSGFFVFHLKHLNMINAAIWSPLIFYLIEKYFLSKKKKKYLLFLALIFSIQFFAGHPQISYISIFSSFIYFLLRFCFKAIDIKKVSINDWIIKVILPWLFIGTVAFGISAIQFFPTMEISSLSERNSWINYENSTRNIFPPRQLLTVFNPYLFGNPAQDLVDGRYDYLDIFWENNCYFGLLAAIFAILSLVCLIKTEKNIKLYGLLLLLFLFFIFGRYNFLYIFTWLFIPGMKLFRFSQRFLLPFILILSILAGFGFDLAIKLIKIIFDKWFKPKITQILLILLSLVFILILIVDIFIYSNQYVSAMPQDYFKPNRVSTWLLSQKQANNFSYLSINWQDSWASAVKGSNGWLNMENIYLYRNLIPPNLNLFFNVSTCDDRPWLEGGQLYAPTAKLWQKARDFETSDTEKKEIILDDTFLKIYGMQGVKYFFSYFTLNNQNLKIIQSFIEPPLPELKIYENPFYLPKAFIVYDYFVEKNQIKSLEKIANDFYDFKKEVMLESPPSFLADSLSISDFSDIKSVSWENNKVLITTDNKKEGLLFLSLTKYPGWQVRVNGKKTPIISANYAFSAVELPIGENSIIFEFKPFSFYLGATITFITLLILLSGILLLFYFNRKMI